VSGSASAGAAYVDLHCHGALGHSFDNADAGGVAAAVGFHESAGTGSMLLSLVSAPLDVMIKRIAELRAIVPSLPPVAGLHLEGPFLAPARRGAHDPTALTPPTTDAVRRLIEAGAGIVRQVTIAPELPGAMATIDVLVEAGVTVAVGHTEADYDTAATAFARGARLLTHAFNAMPGLHHRAPGPVGAALDHGEVVLEVIADTQHVHPSLLRALFAAAPERVAIVTDAMSATGLGDGEYELGGLAVTVSGGRPVLAGTDTLAGSTLTMQGAVETLCSLGIDPDLVARAATETPARFLRAQH
jgi:N-acetylglucosamine-6-phosphate deacetylase